MKIRLLSDLHTEFKLPYKTHRMSQYLEEDVLVLAGDIASGSSNTVEVLKFYKSLGFPNVVYVPGNHEYYGTSIEDFNSKLHTKLRGIDGIHFLNPGKVVIGDTIFVGATLWTNFRDKEMAKKVANNLIADFRLIKTDAAKTVRLTPDNVVALHREHLEYIKTVYETRGDKKVVVVTHFLPCTECIAPRWQKPDDLLNCYFANDLGNWVRELEDTTWLFGHTHDAVDMVLGTTRLVANPHGYYNSLNDGIGFDHFKTITI